VIADLTAVVALVAALGGLVRLSRERLDRGADPAMFGVAGAAVGAVALVAVDRGALLHVRYAIGDGLVASDAALVLALALLGCLAAALTLGADRLARPIEVPPLSGLARTTGRRALLLAVGLLVIGLGLVVMKARASLGLAEARTDLALLGLALVASGLGSAGLLMVPAPSAVVDASGEQRSEDVLTRVTVAATLAAAAAAGVEGWLRSGSVMSRDLEALVAAALVGLAALPPAPWPLARQVVLVIALVAALAR
jgi:hypothetical protein